MPKDDPISDVSKEFNSDKFLIDKKLAYDLEQLTSGVPAVHHMIFKRLDSLETKLDELYDRQNIQIKNLFEERDEIYRELFAERDLRVKFLQDYQELIHLNELLVDRAQEIEKRLQKGGL